MTSIETKKIRRKKVFFTKTDIMSVLGGSAKELEGLLSVELKKKLNFKKGRQYFRDKDVFEMYQEMYPLKSIDEVKSMIKY